jgi:hypothetical protein
LILWKGKMPRNVRSLQELVGDKTYSVWVEMLGTLVPSGRTHRLSVLVAGMLQYAYEIAEKIEHRNKEQHSVAMSLIDTAETSDPEEISELLHDVVDRLFMDAGVEYERVSKGGDPYSIADEAYNEFARWFDYPWD